MGKWEGRKSRPGPAAQACPWGRRQEARGWGALVTRWRCGSTLPALDLGYKPSKQSVSAVFTHAFKQFSASRPLPGSPTLKEAACNRCLGWGQACPLHQLPGQAGPTRPNFPSAPSPAGLGMTKMICHNHLRLGGPVVLLPPSQASTFQPVRIWPPEPAPREAAWSPHGSVDTGRCSGSTPICPPTSSGAQASGADLAQPPGPGSKPALSLPPRRCPGSEVMSSPG